MSESLSNVSLLNVKTHARTTFAETWGTNLGVCVDPTKSLVYVPCFDGDLWSCDLKTGRHAVFGRHAAGTTNLALADEGQILVSAGTSPIIKLWNTAENKVVSRLKAEGTRVPAIDVDTARGLLASASDNGKVQLWSLKSRQPVASWQAHQTSLKEVAFSPDAALLATSCPQEVKLWNRATQELVATLDSSADVLCLKFTPDGKLLVAATQASDYKVPGLVLVWDVQSHALLKRFEGHKAAVRGLAISPDGETAATSSWDTSVRLWKLPK